MRREIIDLGVAMGPQVLALCEALYDDEQRALADRVPRSAADIPYGPHRRHRLDIYGERADALKPVMLFVHGGGFVMGDKGDNGRWANAHVGRMAAEAGLLGVVMNYRLAPDVGWPAGSDDVASAVEWLRAHVRDFGGDPGAIILCGTSAGAIHIAGYLTLEPAAASLVRGAILLSGLYGYTAPEDRDLAYYGPADLYPDRAPREGVAETTMPILVACAEYDPPRFQEEFLGLLGDRLKTFGALPKAYIASGHNHYSLAMHIGTSDGRLSAEIIRFIRQCCG